MASYSDLTVYDRTPVTPVLHTLAPMGRSGEDSVKWREAGTVPAGDKIVTARVNRLSDGGYRNSLKFKDPKLVTQTLGGIDSYIVQDEILSNIDVRFPPNATLQRRKDHLTMLANLLLEAPIDDAFAKLENWNS